MKTASQSSFGEKSDWWKSAGWAWFALLMSSVIYWRLAHAPTMRHRDVLDLGEDDLVPFFILVPIAGLGCITCLAWAGLGLRKLLVRARDWWLPWSWLTAFSVLFWGLIVKKDDSAIPNPITPESEVIYLEFAKAVRAELGTSNLEYLSLDQKQRPEKSAAALAAQKRLLLLVPEYWPRGLLEVYIDDNRVRLSRGSGMLGQVGVMIYDNGSVVLHTPDELEKNYYLPNQKRITDRLWFFTSG